MARKSFLATLIGAAALAVPSAFADKGGIPHDGSNGQGRSAAQADTTAQGKALAKGRGKVKVTAQAKAKGHAKTHGSSSAQGKALAKGHAKTHGSSSASSQGKALAKGHAQAKGQTKVNTHAKAGKTTFCHATGSATNPYVTITTSNNALGAHTRHQDGRDIVPAPEGGCPGGTEGTNTPGLPPTDQKLGKTTICHATGSATNPFVMITISDNALPAHTAHQDGRDVIPASGGTCPGGTEISQQPSGGDEQGGTNIQTPAGLTPASGTQGQVGVLGESTTSPAGSNGSNGSPNNVNVLGESTGSAPSASSSPAATATRASSSNGLPFTGTDAIIVAILGLAALLLGVTVRRATTNRA
jgi:hypothetical protein